MNFRIKLWNCNVRIRYPHRRLFVNLPFLTYFSSSSSSKNWNLNFLEKFSAELLISLKCKELRWEHFYISKLHSFKCFFLQSLLCFVEMSCLFYFTLLFFIREKHQHLTSKGNLPPSDVRLDMGRESPLAPLSAFHRRKVLAFVVLSLYAPSYAFFQLESDHVCSEVFSVAEKLATTGEITSLFWCNFLLTCS